MRRTNQKIRTQHSIERCNPIAVCIAACALFAATLATAPKCVKAQEVQITGPLAGAPAVRNKRVYRKGRFFFQPFIGFTLQDEFSRTMLLGGQLNYHLTDWLGIGLWGAFGLAHIDTGLTGQVGTEGQVTSRNRLSLPDANRFEDQIGNLNWMGAVQATFIPLRGKLGMFEKLFVDTDFYLFGGLAFVGVEERADVTDPNICGSDSAACDATQSARASRVALAPTFGAGLSLYANEFIAIRFEWRALPFSWNTSGTDESGVDVDGNPGDGGFPDGRINSDDRSFHFNHMVTIGAAIYLPFQAGISE